MIKTTVYFVGGPKAGTKKDMPEPLASTFTHREVGEGASLTESGRAHAGFNGIGKDHLYILHTIRSRGGRDSRIYVHNEKELGGITAEDVAHLPR
jgi:hypothetical protein